MEKQPKINTAVEVENSIYFGSFEVYTRGGRVANSETFHILMMETLLRCWSPVLSILILVVQYILDD